MVNRRDLFGRKTYKQKKHLDLYLKLSIYYYFHVLMIIQYSLQKQYISIMLFFLSSNINMQYEYTKCNLAIS